VKTQAQLLAQAFTALPVWRCIPCGCPNFNAAAHCTMCGRRREDATDAARWERFFAVDAVIASRPDCPHDHVLKDDDGRDRWFYVCDDCDQVVHLTEPDEDGQSYWEAIE
jgi:hypothetical protein